MSVKQPITIIDAEDDADFMRCVDYILRRELGVIEDDGVKPVRHKYTMAEFAALHGVSPQAVYKWLDKWTENGLLKKTRLKLSIGSVEEVTLAERGVLAEWGAIINRMIDISLSGKEHNAVNATIFLKQEVVNPIMAAQPDPGDEEAEYIKGKAEHAQFNPMAFLEDGTA